MYKLMESTYGVSFREAGEEHLAEILAIYTHYVLYTTITFHTQPLTEADMRAIVFHRGHRYRTFVILEDGQLCGYVLLFPYKSREAYDGTAEVSVYLHPARVGHGLGSLALSHIEAYARNQDFHVLLAIICGENFRSIRLFERAGFSKCAHFKEVGRKFGRLLDVVGYQKIIG